MAQALVPLKDLVEAKTRLAGLLSPSERRALAQAMLEDVLALLACHPEISGTTLVSDDPAAYLLAAQYGAAHWPETDLGCRGLNAVVHSASAKLMDSCDEPILLLHADLPLLSIEDITAVLVARRASRGLVVGCDRHGTGTNLLCFDAASAPRFCFGQDSCARHLAAASDQGIGSTVLRRPGIGLDVDEPRDLELLMARLLGHDAGHTAVLMRRSGLGSRIRMALASLAAPEMPRKSEEVR